MGNNKKDISDISNTVEEEIGEPILFDNLKIKKMDCSEMDEANALMESEGYKLVGSLSFCAEKDLDDVTLQEASELIGLQGSDLSRHYLMRKQ